MFYEIDGKFYIKMREFYNEVTNKNGNVVPLFGEEYRIYDFTSKAKEISLDKILEPKEENVENKKKKGFKNKK